tara:strand:+ start:17 stop:508 length:492 start_codon:yes stop_codon:yes gene_type:complete
MNIQKIEKLFRLATKNPNKNEAMVAATKFIEAVARENINVQLYKGQKPASQQDIQSAIDNAYRKGIQDVKKQYQQELDRHLNAKYNEGYLDGKREGYSYSDMQNQYNKGFIEGKNSVAIQKTESGEIVKEKTTKTVSTCNHNTTAASHIFFSHSTGTLHISNL